MEKEISEGIRSKLLVEISGMSPELYKMLLISKSDEQLQEMLDKVASKIARLENMTGIKTREGDPMTSYNALCDKRSTPYEKFLNFANADKELKDPAEIKTYELGIIYANKDFVKDVVGYVESSDEYPTRSSKDLKIAQALQTTINNVECNKYLEEAKKSLQKESSFSK